MGLAIRTTAQAFFSDCKTVLCVLHLLLQSYDFQSGAGLDLYYKVAIFQPELVLRALDLRYTAAIVQLEQKTCTLRTRLVLQSYDFRAGAPNLYFAYYTCTSKLRSSSQSWKLVLHVLYLHYKVVSFQLVLETCTRRALDLCSKFAILQLELVLQSCDFPARAGNL